MFLKILNIFRTSELLIKVSKKINRNFEIVFTAFKKLFITKSNLIANEDGYKCIFLIDH